MPTSDARTTRNGPTDDIVTSKGHAACVVAWSVAYLIAARPHARDLC